MVSEFLDLTLVLVFLALGQGQCLDPWLQLKQPNMEQEGLGPSEGLETLVEPVSLVVWQELDPLLLLLPKPLPKPLNLAWGYPVGSESEDWELEVLGPVELSQGLGPLEVCPQLQQLKQPNTELQQGLALDCLLFSQVVEPGAWELVVGPAWGNPVAGRESELPRTPDSRPHQRWCYCLVENVNPL